MNICNPIGGNDQMQRCDVDIGQVIVNVFAGGSSCSGSNIDTYRVPTGCLPSPNGASTRDLCMSVPSIDTPFQSYGAGVVTTYASSSDACSGPITQTINWQFQPLNTCIIPTDGTAPTQITECSADDGTYQVSMYEGAADCSGEATSTDTQNLSSCGPGDNGLWSRQQCITAV